MKRLTILTAVCLVVSSLPALASTSDATLPYGTPIDVTIDEPAHGTEYVLPDGATTVDVDAVGTASVGFGEGAATVVYVIDVSGSVDEPAGVDCDGDAAEDTILGCQIAALVALNQVAIASGSVDAVGLAAYGQSGVVADMTPAGGDDPLTPPDAGPGDVETVIESVIVTGAQAGPTLFTPKNAHESHTNFAAGVAAATSIVTESPNSTNIVVFLSDGLSNDGLPQFSTNVGALAATGAVAHTFAVGAASSCTGGSHGTLQQIADQTGGTCTAVTDPAELADVISSLFDFTLDALELSVDGGPASTIPAGDISLLLPHPGPVSVDYSTPVAGLGLGAHDLCVTAFGTDAGGTGDSGEACNTIYVYDISLAPPHEDKELGVDTDHTVTATIAGADDTTGDREVTFTVVDGPNAGETGTDTTAANGTVSWTYTNSGPGGTDTIEACFTVADPTGDEDCATATVEWADTTPPLAACLPGPNPHGEHIPPAGWSSLPGSKGGQNEDGFYDLFAEDAVDPAPMVFAVDGATGYVFGPYPDGTVIKWTQAPGAEPAEKKMGSHNGKAGAVDWHLRGQGDMLVFAVDASGNQSDQTVCLVPPFPK